MSLAGLCDAERDSCGLKARIPPPPAEKIPAGIGVGIRFPAGIGLASILLSSAYGGKLS